jgi:hypothetical protein
MRGGRRSVELHRGVDEEFVEGQEGRRVVISGIKVESVVEILGLSLLKLVVVARRKQGSGAKSTQRNAKMMIR